ncbi:hypothetical protein D9M71_322550 [compost metagenome]
MGGIFGGAKPKPPAVVQEPAPVIDDASRDQDMADAQLRRRGRSATILAGGSPLGTTTGASTAPPKTLLGS